MRLCAYLLALVTTAAAFRVGVEPKRIAHWIAAPTLSASSLPMVDEHRPIHMSAAPHDSGLATRRDHEAKDISQAEAIILPLTAVIAGSALLGFCSTHLV